MLRNLSMMALAIGLAVSGGQAAAQNKPGFAAQWCYADMMVDGAKWKVYSANFANVNPIDNAYMLDATKAYYYGEEWRKMLQARYATTDFFPSTCEAYALEWRDDDAKPYTTEAAALAAAKKKRDEYRKYKNDGVPMYAGTIDMEWVPTGTERMGTAEGEKRTPNPDLGKKKK